MALKSIVPQTYNSPLDAYMRDQFTHYDLSAPYQRGEVWSVTQKQNLIKSFLLGLPVGGIFVNAHSYNRENPEIIYRVIDGKQRITAVRDFEMGKFAVPADWFEKERVVESCGTIQYEGAKCEGVKYSGLSDVGKRFYGMCMLPSHHVRLPDLKAEADLYLLINFGGVPQTIKDKKRAQDIAEHTI